MDLARLFGLMPWDIERLSIRHYLAFTASVDAHRRAAKEAGRG